MTDTQDIPADELEDLQRLLRLKNYEQPADGYFEDFLSRQILFSGVYACYSKS